jgi:hypothetical protein
MTTNGQFPEGKRTEYDYGKAKHVRIDVPGEKKKMWWEPRLSEAGISIADLPLYNIQEATEQHDRHPEEWVLWPEGEKCVHIAEAMGFAAVTNGGGAGQRLFGESLLPLAEWKIVLMPDKGKVGAGLMDFLAPELVNLGCQLKRLELPGLDEGQDVADWAKQFETEVDARKSLTALIEKAPLIKPKKSGEDFTDLIAEEDEPVVEYVPGLFNEGTYILAGAPKLGKSWLTLSIAQGLAMGGAVLGRILVDPCDVLYLCLEDGRRRFKRRAKMRAEGLALPERGRFEVHFTWSKLDEGGAEALEAWVAVRRAAERRCCVVIDTGIRLRPGDNGKQGDMYRQDYEYLAQITDIMQKHNALCIVVSHTRKAEALDFIDMVIGSHGITGAVEGVMVFTRERHSKKATLMGTDKDGEEIKVVMEWNDINGGWNITDSPDEATEQRQKVMGLIRKAKQTIINTGKPMGLSELRLAMGVQRNALVEALGLAVLWGELTVNGAGKRGDPERYDLPGGIDTDSVPGIDTE